MKIELKTLDHEEWYHDTVTFEEYEDDAVEIKYDGNTFRIKKKELTKVLTLFGE